MNRSQHFISFSVIPSLVPWDSIQCCEWQISARTWNVTCISVQTLERVLYNFIVIKCNIHNSVLLQTKQNYTMVWIRGFQNCHEIWKPLGLDHMTMFHLHKKSLEGFVNMIMLKNAVNYGLLVTVLMINVWLWTLCCRLIYQWFNVLPLYATRMCYLRQDHNITTGCTNILRHNLTVFSLHPVSVGLLHILFCF